MSIIQKEYHFIFKPFIDLPKEQLIITMDGYAQSYPHVKLNPMIIYMFYKITISKVSIESQQIVNGNYDFTNRRNTRKTRERASASYSYHLINRFIVIFIIIFKKRIIEIQNEALNPLSHFDEMSIKVLMPLFLRQKKKSEIHSQPRRRALLHNEYAFGSFIYYDLLKPQYSSLRVNC